VREIGAFCREKGLIFILDTAQTAGLAPIDMDDIGVDALCFTGHKALYGLQGTGGICLSERFTPRPLLTGGSGSRSFELTQPAELPDLLEAGTLNGHGIAGLLAGVRYVRANGPAQLLAQANRLAARFYRAAKALGGAVFYGDYTAYDAYDDYDAAAQRMPIVALNLGRLPSGDVAGSLSEKYGIAVRAGAHCAPLLHRRFGTLTQGAARFSFSHMNTEAEVDAALAALAAIKANPAL
jgi:selenocysteine lyase/cysteine desulfurase